MKAAIYAQFHKPTGPVGVLAGWIMAHRPSNRVRNRWTVDLLDIEPDDCVLEYGHGPGLAIDLVARRLVSGMVVGIDHSPVMRRQAQRRNRRWLDAGRVALRDGGIAQLDMPGEFDKIFSINVLQFDRDRARTMLELNAALAPGGLLAATYQPRHQGASGADAERFAESLVVDMQAVGLVAIRIARLAMLPIPAVCVLGRRA